MKDGWIPATIVAVVTLAFAWTAATSPENGRAGDRPPIPPSTPSLAESADSADVVADFFSQTDTIAMTEVRPVAPEVLVGDADGSGGVDIDDALFIIDYCLGGGPEPPRYPRVAQAYVRTWQATVLIDAAADTVIRVLSLLERGDVFYVPVSDDDEGHE